MKKTRIVDAPDHIGDGTEFDRLAVSPGSPPAANRAPARRESSRMRRLVVPIAFFAVTLIGGAGLSAIPRSPAEVTRVVRPSGAPRTQPPAPMLFVQESRGFPFRAITVERGPADAAVRTEANINIRARSFAMNAMFAALLAVLALALIRRPMVKDHDV